MGAGIDLLLRCRCGAVRARVAEVSPSTTNHVVCYCKDCRAFARWLDRADVLDEAGGSCIVQVARGRVAFDAGLDQLACVRLSDKGLHRWYAACCRAPFGNTLPRMPFLGIVDAAFDPADDAERRRRAIPPLVRIHTQSATGRLPPGGAPTLPMLAHITRLMLTWSLRGLGGETFFDPRTGKARVEPRVLTPAERAALRD
jgi:hypothetical protein